jgi:undecaprenyl diphosphate synthase
LPIIEGYRRGIGALREIAKACRDFGVPVLTAFGFSTENWKRDPSEIATLFDVCTAFARSEGRALRREGVRVHVLGDLRALPDTPRAALQQLVAETASCEAVVLNLAVNYSGRSEIVDAVRTIARDAANGRIPVDAINEALLEARLFTAGLPDPDLLIRPGGEYRLSNFLLYQLAYTELWVSDVAWPDFKREHFEEALFEYQRRHRRFGAS